MAKLKKNQEKERCILYYQHEAKNYDNNRFSCECSKMNDTILKDIVYNFLKNSRFVLDAGTGSGRFAIDLAKKGKSVVALDGSREMIMMAKEKSKLNGCENKIHFIVGDIENLPFKNAAFDGICSIIVLIHFSSRVLIISEFSRVLKVGGFVVFDVPIKALSKGYGFFISLIGKTTFKDYHYSMKDAKKLLHKNSIEIIENKRLDKIPKLLIHFFLCKLNFRFIGGMIEKLEKYNFGAKAIIKGVKIK